ncbi:hypothetical protein HW555_000992 [Spodoptera exigua]|uniref:Nucleoporin NSP1-like C-terminal domain-containing protein n=1 Tax=Spodoptera exigua TaxID=7107 RepID=A0A835GQP8_SPOEX|nr:hypothetical protein HW555_000992 [Spodoptera exigua]
MSFTFGSATTTAASTFGTNSPSTGSGFAFGSGDAAKQGLFGAGNAENKPAFNFSSPSGGGFSFGAAKTTAAAPSVFSTPVTSSTAPAFGASKPISFGGFTSPPNQTVGSPGFPQMQSGATTAAPTFGTPTTQASTGFGASPSTGFGFGQTATTQPSTGFGGQAATTGFGSTPATTGFGSQPATATSGFGFSTPASGFSAPQSQANAAATTTSTAQPTQSFMGGATPGFGQSAFGAKPGSAFSFGGGNTAAPAFGSSPATTTTASAFGQKPATLGFGTMGATTAPASQTTTNTAGQTGLSSGISFGQTTATTATTAPTFGTATPSFQAGQFGGLTGAQQSTPINFSTSLPSSQPQTGLSFAPASTAQPAPSLGFATTTTQSGLSFGGSLSTPASTAATSAPSLKPTLGQALPAGQFPKTSGSLSFAPATTTPSSTATTSAAALGAWSSPLTTSTQPTTGLSFGTTTTSAAPALSFGVSTATTSTLQTGFGLTSTAAKTGLSFGKPTTSVAASSAASTSAPSGIIALGKSTATTTMASLTTATTTTASVPPQMVTSITFAQLEENINKWTLELEEQEKTFINQATQINAWDRLLIANGEKIVELNDAVQSVKNEQQSLEHELDFVLAQQKELEDLLEPMEKQLSEETVDRLRDPEREHMYSLAENLDTQLRQMSEDLKEVIEHLNETNRSQDSNDPIVQIGRILNAHMSSMQWIDNSIAQISTKLDQLKATHDTLRRDNERSYQLTYN